MRGTCSAGAALPSCYGMYGFWATQTVMDVLADQSSHSDPSDWPNRSVVSDSIRV